MNRLREKPDVRLLGFMQGNNKGKKGEKKMGPEDFVVYAARACFKPHTASQMFEKDCRKKTPEERMEGLVATLRETSGRGHSAVLDLAGYIFEIEDIPRLVTLQLCLPHYLMHLQQSLRRAEAKRGFYVPDAFVDSEHMNEAIDLQYKAFELYEEMSKNGIPAEDARNVLPLYTKTNIHTAGDVRELNHIRHMSAQGFINSITTYTVEKMIEVAEKEGKSPNIFQEMDTNYEVLAWYPSAQLFAPAGWNETLDYLIKKHGRAKVRMFGATGSEVINEKGLEKAIKERNEAELANLKHFHSTFLARMSLSALHQAIRQRTWDQSVESIYSAAERGRFVIPPSIKKSKYLDKFSDMNQKMLGMYHKLVGGGMERQEAIGVVSHSLEVYDLIHVNGWNAIHSIGKRTCTGAQWEIRGIATRMAKGIREASPTLGKYAMPQGVTYGRCPEANNCGRCEKILKKRK